MVVAVLQTTSTSTVRKGSASDLMAWAARAGAPIARKEVGRGGH